MQNEQIQEREYDVFQAAQRLNLSIGTVRRMVSSRELRHLRVGSGRGRIRIPESSIQEYLAQRTVPVQQANEAKAA